MTGTPTRNNALEIYNQLELLSNNSLVFLDRVEDINEYDRSLKEIREVPNRNYMKPYPAYGGLSIFRKEIFSVSMRVGGACGQS